MAEDQLQPTQRGAELLRRAESSVCSRRGLASSSFLSRVEFGRYRQHHRQLL